MKNKQNGFTLIELIMVMIILGVLAAVAIPRYMDTIENAEESGENAVITNIEAALENYAVHKLLDSGRRIWPDNPFTALKVVPDTYTDDGTWPDSDNEWTFVDGDPAYISHQRADIHVGSGSMMLVSILVQMLTLQDIFLVERH